jgi:hypothetical protein
MNIGKLYKIKDGKLEDWRTWCQKLQLGLRGQATATLSEEAVLFEVFTNFQLLNTWYALGLTIEDSSKIVGKPDMSNPINIEHRRIKKDCLEPVTESELGYWLSVYGS